MVLPGHLVISDVKVFFIKLQQMVMTKRTESKGIDPGTCKNLVTDKGGLSNQSGPQIALWDHRVPGNVCGRGGDCNPSSSGFVLE